MTIAEVREKCKSILAQIPRDVLLASVALGASFAGFGLGFWAGQGSDSPTAEASFLPAAPAAAAAAQGPDANVGQVVASKNGTKYYLPTCSGAARIAEKNKVWFPNPAAARAQGYTPAANCKGLE